jgi:hypothetical protein
VECDVGVLDLRAHAQHVRVRLAVEQAGKAVEAVTANATAGLGVRFVEVDPDRQVERSVPRANELVV